MSVRTIFIFIFAGFAFLLGALVYLAYLAGHNRQALAASEERRYASYQLADELRQSSDDLTRLARTYVATGDPVYEQYFQEVLAIRSGEKPRPENHAGIYWDFVLATGEKPTPDGPPVALQALMREMQFTGKEFLKLAESEKRSNDLVFLEEKAMNAVRGRFDDGSGNFSVTGDPDLEMARKIMFGDDYHRAKAAIMKPIAEFQGMLDERTAREVLTLQKQSRVYGAWTLGLAGVGLVFTFFACLVLHHRVLKPVRTLATAAKRVEEGDYEQSVGHAASDELGHLASSFNLMTGAIRRDIRAREETQEALAQAKEAADAGSKAKSDFLSNMSHELRTPLNGVLGYVQILQRDRSLGPSQKQSLDAINSCGEHLLNLINDVLDLSKIEAGRLEISTKATDLSQLLDGVRDIVKPKAEDKGLTFTIKTSPEVPRGIVTDPIKLRQVLVNLLGNSVKFTPEGAISLRVAETRDGFLRFDIEDTGMGISAEKLQDIFEPFKQAEGGVSEGGTGLGLAISRRIAEALGGSLRATSELGEGSCFTLAIPLEETDDYEGEGSDFSIATPDTHAGFCLPPGAECSALVADDRETNRDILNQILTDAGFEVVLVNDGDDALAELRRRDFDIFLCDVRMPRMNGIEVIREIRNDDRLKNHIVFAVTASVFPEFRDKALEAGFDDFLAKPFRISELARKLSEFLDIEFVYLSADEEGSPASGADPVEYFETLPGETIRELAGAAKLRNFTRLREIANKLLAGEQTAAAGQHLEGLIDRFDIAGLQSLVEGLSVPE